MPLLSNLTPELSAIGEVLKDINMSQGTLKANEHVFVNLSKANTSVSLRNGIGMISSS